MAPLESSLSTPRRGRSRRPALRRRTAFLVASLVAVLASTTPPATGQVEAEIDSLETRRDEIGDELAVIDQQLGETERELVGLQDAVTAATIGIELLADEFERAVDDRREPASTRVEIAIIGFTRGDPRQTALLDEVMALQGSDDQSRARELYTAVIDDAQARLEAADERLRVLTDELATARESRATVVEQRDLADATLTELGRRRAELVLELEETVTRIEQLRALEDTALLTGLTTFDAQIRPVLAVKIDNVGAARPQSGINQADIVYVEEVEGGLTRFAAVFHSTTPAQVGPVRSMRTGDFDLLGQFNSPLFANSGGNRIARSLLRESSLVDIGAASHGDLYFRTNRPAPHNLFMNPANLWAVGQGPDYATGNPPPIFRFREAGQPIPADTGPASGVDIDYGQTTVSYSWNGSGWDRSQDGAATLDSDGVRVAPTTVVVQLTNYDASEADLASPEAITVGRGDAWILTEGRVAKGFWRRDDATSPIEYVDGSGNFLTSLPGRTWVEMPRPGRATLR